MASAGDAPSAAPRVVIDVPSWVEQATRSRQAYGTDDEKMALVISLARERRSPYRRAVRRRRLRDRLRAPGGGRRQQRDPAAELCPARRGGRDHARPAPCSLV